MIHLRLITVVRDNGSERHIVSPQASRLNIRQDDHGITSVRTSTGRVYYFAHVRKITVKEFTWE